MIWRLRLYSSLVVFILLNACKLENNSVQSIEPSWQENLNEQVVNSSIDSLEIKSNTDTFDLADTVISDKINIKLDSVVSVEKESKVKKDNAIVKHKMKSHKKVYPFSLDSISWDTTLFAFDTIIEGEIVKHKFFFKNLHQMPIEVESTYPDCGCTVPSFPFLPIQQNEKGFIGVTYNSVGKVGRQEATVNVKFAKTKNEATLKVVGYVKQKEKESSINDNPITEK